MVPVFQRIEAIDVTHAELWMEDEEGWAPLVEKKAKRSFSMRVRIGCELELTLEWGRMVIAT